MPRPLMPAGDRRVTVTLTLTPQTLDLLDVLVAECSVSRGRVIDQIFESILRSRVMNEKVRSVYGSDRLLGKLVE